MESQTATPPHIQKDAARTLGFDLGVHACQFLDWKQPRRLKPGDGEVKIRLVDLLYAADLGCAICRVFYDGTRALLEAHYGTTTCPHTSAVETSHRLFFTLQPILLQVRSSQWSIECECQQRSHDGKERPAFELFTPPCQFLPCSSLQTTSDLSIAKLIELLNLWDRHMVDRTYRFAVLINDSLRDLQFGNTCTCDTFDFIAQRLTCCETEHSDCKLNSGGLGPFVYWNSTIITFDLWTTRTLGQ
jgi:hypothetical protein